MIVKVLVPQYGMAADKVEVVKWYKKEGEKVEKDESLVQVITAKINSDIPAPESGTLVKIYAKEGESIEAGKVIAEIDTGV
jgi:pyruvate/2-oxoglutarate dehydrogenase complex dihydrolipoamide acyltransferase (E2) component